MGPKNRKNIITRHQPLPTMPVGPSFILKHPTHSPRDVSCFTGTFPNGALHTVVPRLATSESARVARVRSVRVGSGLGTGCSPIAKAFNDQEITFQMPSKVAPFASSSSFLTTVNTCLVCLVHPCATKGFQLNTNNDFFFVIVPASP